MGNGRTSVTHVATQILYFDLSFMLLLFFSNDNDHTALTLMMVFVDESLRRRPQSIAQATAFAEEITKLSVEDKVIEVFELSENVRTALKQGTMTWR